MNVAQKVEERNPYQPAREELESLVSRLEEPATHQMSHGQVEELIHKDGMEVLRLLFQGHIDSRGDGDVGSSVVGSDGHRRTRKRRNKSRRLMSVFGLVLVTRVVYGLREGGAPGLAPMDASLNLPKESYSHGVRRHVALEAARGSFDEAAECVGRMTGAHVPKRQAEDLAARAAADFDDFYSSRAHAEDNGDAPGEILVITVDGKGIVMRHDALREATRKAAKKQQRKLKKRLTKGEKRNRKRMATVASVYTIDRDVRTADDILGNLNREEPSKGSRRRRPKPDSKRVWASVAKTSAAVIEAAFEEASRRDPDRSKRWVAVVDGDKKQLRSLHKAAERHGVELTIVLDVIHAIEYLWKAARVFYAETDPAGEEWVHERLLRLLRGTSSSVAAGIRRSATLRKLSTSKREPADKAADYLLKYRDYLHYDEYLAAGLPIASGVIEGACRYLVKDRMDITGARWGLEGAEAVLKLRALRASGDFDQYWSFHEQQQLSNRHAAYADELAPPVSPPRPRGRPQLRVVKS